MSILPSGLEEILAEDEAGIGLPGPQRAALRGEKTGSSQTHTDAEVPSVLRPKEIQAKIRAGASVEQIASAAGVDIDRVERFANPVLLERSRAAELATAAHPVLADGPSVLTLLETVTSALVARGLDPEATSWDAWRNEDGRWTVQGDPTEGALIVAARISSSRGSPGGIRNCWSTVSASVPE